jgi:hypothetical protein
MAQFVSIPWLRFVAAAISLFAGIALPGGTAIAQDIEIIETDWQLEPSARVEVGAVSARSATRDEQIVLNGDAFTVRAQAALVLENDTTSVRFELDRIEVFRTDKDRRDVNRDRITLQIDQEISEDVDIQVRGRAYDDLITVESPDTDEIQGSVRVTYEPERKHRVRVRGTWRDREYDNGPLEATTGEGPRVDAQYRHRFGRYHYATLDLRAESISSDDPRRGYSRQSARFSYTQPITRDLRVRPALEYLNTRFDGRLNEAGRQRWDRLFVPEVELHWWKGPWRVEAEAKYIFSGSNVEVREREGHRLTLSVGYVF